jgi:hypothetical protein
MKSIFRVTMWASLVAGLAPAAMAQTAVDEPWSLNVSLAGSYEGNALFTGPTGDEEFSHRVQAAISRAWALERGSAALVGGASQNFYRKSTSLNDFTYNAGARFSYAVTRRLQWSMNGTVSSGLARDDKVLIDNGLVLPSVTARSGSASSAFAYQLTHRTQLSWSVTESGVGFSSAVFVGGTTLGSNLGIARQLTNTQSLSLVQQYQRTFTGDVQSGVHGLIGSWQGSYARWAIHAGSGINASADPATSHYRAVMAVSVGASRPLFRGQSFSAGYNRGIDQTFGVDQGNHVVDVVTGSYAIALSRSLGTAFGGSYSRGTSATSQDLRIEGETATASLSYQVTTKLAVGVGASIYSRTAPPEPRVTSYRMSTSLTYGTSWR